MQVDAATGKAKPTQKYVEAEGGPKDEAAIAALAERMADMDQGKALFDIPIDIPVCITQLYTHLYTCLGLLMPLSVCLSVSLSYPSIHTCLALPCRQLPPPPPLPPRLPPPLLPLLFDR